MLSYRNEVLDNIRKDPRPDKFYFTINNSIYEVPLSYALAISSFIAEQYLIDPTFKELEIPTNETEFLNFISGKEITKETFIQLGTTFQNREMIQQWKHLNGLRKENVIERIKFSRVVRTNDNKFEMNLDPSYFDLISEEIDFISQHLEEMKEDIKGLTDEELIHLLRNRAITVETEDTIWTIVNERLQEIKRTINNNNETINIKKKEKVKKIRRILLENIEIKYLSNEHFKKYIEEIEAEDITNIEFKDSITTKRNETANIWNKIKEIILNDNNNNSKIKREEKPKGTMIMHKEGTNFDGIIKYLKGKH